MSQLNYILLLYTQNDKNILNLTEEQFYEF